MTIAAGFTCSNGIVLCADTEISVQGWMKYPGSKFRVFMDLDSEPVFTFAGDVGFCDMFINRIVARIQSEKLSGNDLYKAIEQEVLDTHNTFAGNEYEQGSELLMSIRLEGKGKTATLYRIGRGIINPAPSACIGTGQMTGQAMLGELFTPNTMETGRVAVLCAYILADAKAYAIDCGKASQILIIEKRTGYLEFPTRYSPGLPSVEEIEANYREFKRISGDLLLSFGDFRLSMKDFEKKATLLFSNITELRRKSFTEYKRREEEWTDEQFRALGDEEGEKGEK
jgi:20S proteasome alpha/beta subunit